MKNTQSKFFKTKYNALRKAICLTLDELGRSLTVRQLSRYPEIDYNSACVRLPKYDDWGYVGSRAVRRGNHRTMLAYFLTNKGRRFVQTIPQKEQQPYREAVRQVDRRPKTIKELFS